MTVVASNYARKENDLYQTEPWATEALLRVILPSHDSVIWEPAAGNHLIADVLKEYGYIVHTSDIAVYDRKHDHLNDFFEYKSLPYVDAIITNPPYGKSNRDAVRFARHALNICNGWVALLLTAKFDFGKTRTFLFRDNPRFYGKIALIDRISWAGNGETGTEDHAWYIWGPVGQSYTPEMFYEGKVPALEIIA